MTTFKLDNLVAHADICLRQLRIVQDKRSEETYKQCLVTVIQTMYDQGYQHVPDQYIIKFGEYHAWRMENPFPIQHFHGRDYHNFRIVNHLGKDMIFCEDENNSTRAFKLGTYQKLTE